MFGRNKKTKLYMGTVKVGAKGQIVIPKEVRDMFNINPGDVLAIFANTDKGIAINNYEKYANILSKAFTGLNPTDPDNEEE